MKGSDCDADSYSEGESYACQGPQQEMEDSRSGCHNPAGNGVGGRTDDGQLDRAEVDLHAARWQGCTDVGILPDWFDSDGLGGWTNYYGCSW
jgi:hypothetical protein